MSGEFSHGASQIRTENERISKGKVSAGDLEPLTHCGIGMIEAGLGIGFGVMGFGLIADGAERIATHCG